LKLHLSNLDELVQRVRNPHPKNYLNEAIVSYRTGAYRAGFSGVNEYSAFNSFGSDIPFLTMKFNKSNSLDATQSKSSSDISPG
jgi:hypothetical protein